jgi:CheY-like chemotaxis protein
MSDKQISVLLIDDDPETRNIFQMVLAHHHLALAVAEDAEKGFAYLATHHPDIIVLDIFLPGMDGYQALSQIRRHDLAPNSRVIAITSYYTDDTLGDVMERGFNGYLPKPINTANLVSYLQTVATS